MSGSVRHLPFILFAIPFVAVLFGIFMVVVAFYFPDDVVVDDYYKDGMAINRHISKDEKSAELGISLTLADRSSSSLSFAINHADEAALLLRLFHVTDKALDREFVLVRQQDGRYLASDPGLLVLDEDGIWYMEVESAERQWRLRGRIRAPLTTLELGHEQQR